MGNFMEVKHDTGNMETEEIDKPKDGVFDTSTRKMEVGFDGKVTRHAPAQVTPNEDNYANPQTPMDTIRTKNGSTPCRDVRDAIANPDRYTIQVSPNGMRTTISAAIAAGIFEISPDGDLHYATDNSMPPRTEPVQHNSMEPEIANGVNQLRAKLGASAADSAILQAAIQHEDPAKQEAALKRFATDAGAPDVETAANFIDEVVVDVLSSGLAELRVRHPDIAPEKALEFYKGCSAEVRHQLFTAFYHGSRSAVDHLADRIRLNNSK